MRALRLAFVTLCLLGCAAAAFAGPMPSCVGSATSASGSVLVTRDLSFDDPDSSHTRRITASVYRVTRPLDEPNRPLRVAGPDHYWPDPMMESFFTWSVSFTRKSSSYVPACQYLLVTDDAQFLIFVDDNVSRAPLHIYRCCEHTANKPGPGFGPEPGILVREIPLGEIIPPPQQPTGYTDHTPQWYSEGTWSFTSDNRTLDFHRFRGDTVHIDLATGTVRRNTAP